MNPTLTSEGTPEATSTGSIAVSSIDRIGFRSVNFQSGTSFLIDNLIISDAWEDNFIPEPASTTFLLLFAGVSVMRRRR